MATETTDTESTSSHSDTKLNTKVSQAAQQSSSRTGAQEAPKPHKLTNQQIREIDKFIFNDKIMKKIFKTAIKLILLNNAKREGGDGGEEKKGKEMITAKELAKIWKSDGAASDSENTRNHAVLLDSLYAHVIKELVLEARMHKKLSPMLQSRYMHLLNSNQKDQQAKIKRIQVIIASSPKLEDQDQQKRMDAVYNLVCSSTLFRTSLNDLYKKVVSLATASKSIKSQTSAGEKSNNTMSANDHEVILEEEWVDPDEENGKAGEPEKATRKNRRGQQARRQIWEKKFGEKAKHVLENKKKPVAAPAPLTPPSTHNAPIKKPAPVHVDPTLHPSWQAKKQLHSGAIVKSTGTKIVFGADDDDQTPTRQDKQDEKTVHPKPTTTRPLERIKSRGPITASTHSNPVYKRKSQNQETEQEILHPSWQAKKLKSAAIQKPSGTKITFD